MPVTACLPKQSICPLQDSVTWYGINYTGTQMTQWDFQNKGTRTSPARLPFVLKVPLRHLRPSVIYSVPCDGILQRAYCLDKIGLRALNKKQNHLKIITINSISGRTKPFFIELVCSNTNLTVTASVPKQQSINCLDEIGQRAITKKIKGSLSSSWMSGPIPSLLLPLWQNESLCELLV